MPFFEVTLSDGTTRILQGHNKTMVREALAGVVLKSVVQKRRCRRCNKAVATVQNTLCQPCWERALEIGKQEWADVPMSEQDLESLVMSFFVEG